MLTTEQALARARELASGDGRVVLGIAGPPGAGKSTLAARIAYDLGDRVRVVGMDGFHFAQRELARLGRERRKGAPDTFDVAGYVALLQRLREPGEAVVHAPEFRRDLEEPVGSAIAIEPDVPLVVTEGNWLLLDDGPWSQVRALLDEAWYLEVPQEARVERLVARHVRYGRSEADARAWVLGTDEDNARLVESARNAADHVVSEL